MLTASDAKGYLEHPDTTRRALAKTSVSETDRDENGLEYLAPQQLNAPLCSPTSL